ncbi:hypothetical protein QWY52_13410 [Staphylococcus aureus]|uniref:hypothetical protein n=1 Tax=Staphylococcus aureus TaxID=1280 RepID=UPI00263C5A38|nr:hypothetical protein [Staphylococcus aureus]MDG6600744.1 hypothetical protein [Staphylococcus aureus]MDG6616926.1 hypothetical protein [Staphylococcus aureus]MDG6622279.1 hypothetical protein [Staphylococcus aureus]MDN5191623.1 hypothetical protein [Staphylococcus aureus]MDN5194271.1 hypothetical protein [Staphylococcus aureus]
MQNLENIISQYKYKWINVQLSAIDTNNDFYLFTTLHDNSDDYYTNIGHLGIKYEGNSKWKIIDFEIDRQYRGQSYGAAMFAEVLDGIAKLNETENVYLYGDISSVYIENQSSYKNVKETIGYKKLKRFYLNLGFTLKDDTRFYKQTSISAIPDWQNSIRYAIEIKDLKLEIAFKDIVLETYEKTIHRMQSDFFGRYLLKKIRNRKS